jgi:deoxyxylulose-5-phosphate synthase
VVPGVLFEGWACHFGPVWARLDVLEETLAISAAEDRCCSRGDAQGRGYGPAESDAGTFHGVGVFDQYRATWLHAQDVTQVFGETAVDRRALAQHGRGHAAMTDVTPVSSPSPKVPERFFDVGRRGTGPSSAGPCRRLLPLCAIYPRFQRLDQIITTLPQDLHAVLCVDRAGWWEDGAATARSRLPAHDSAWC